MKIVETTLVNAQITGQWNDAKMTVYVNSTSKEELKWLLKEICALIGRNE